MGIKENNLLSLGQRSSKSATPHSKIGSSSDPEKSFCTRNRRLIFELKSLFITLTAVICQHFNLFDLSLRDYNFKLIAYICLIMTLKVARLWSTEIDVSLPILSHGLKNLVTTFNILSILIIIYLFCTMFENPTPLRLLFLTY
jgi:hypothetical protein